MTKLGYGIQVMMCGEMKVKNLFLSGDLQEDGGNVHRCTFQTAEENQKTAALSVYQFFSDEEFVEMSKAWEYCEASIPLPEGLPAGTPISMLFTLPEQGDLIIEAYNDATGDKLDVVINVVSEVVDVDAMMRAELDGAEPEEEEKFDEESMKDAMSILDELFGKAKKEDDSEAHKARYEAEHSLLPHLFFNNIEAFLATLMHEEGSILYRIFTDVYRQHGIEMPYEENEFRVEGGKITDDIRVLGLFYPKPEQCTECFCTHIFFTRDLSTVKYFTVEKDFFGKDAVLCAWDEEHRHLNFGLCDQGDELGVVKATEIFLSDVKK